MSYQFWPETDKPKPAPIAAGGRMTPVPHSMLPLAPSSDPDERIAQLEAALDWVMDMLGSLGVGYMPGDCLLAKRWKS